MSPPATQPPRRLVLRKDLARAVRGGHPWLYRDALAPDAGEGPSASASASDRAIADGQLVLVAARDGRPLGRGFWTAAGPIAVRMLTTDRDAEIPALVTARLRAALAQRLATLDLADTDAFRWVHGEADLLPGLHLDLYAGRAAIRFDGAGARAFYLGLDLPAEIAAAAAESGALKVEALVERRRGARSGSAGGGADAAERAVAITGALPGGEIEVRENGLRFGVDLAHGQKGGLFLDQRDNRARVRERARDRRVLNLFGYTGGFSIYAAAGGARATTTVDLAAGAIAAARRNFARNAAAIGAAADAAELVAADAFAFLTAAAGAGRARRWDLVVSDPPSFAPSDRSRPTALRAYRRLHRLCAAVTEPGGLLFAASCSSHVDDSAFVDSVEAGCRDAGRRFTLDALHGAAADHPVLPAFPEGRYLKMVIGTVR